jgi:hypothetical protein
LRIEVVNLIQLLVDVVLLRLFIFAGQTKSSQLSEINVKVEQFLDQRPIFSVHSKPKCHDNIVLELAIPLGLAASLFFSDGFQGFFTLVLEDQLKIIVVDVFSSYHFADMLFSV